MIRSFDVLIPRDFPYALVSFQFYFYNYGSGTVNLYHAAGMELVYEQTRVCYVCPEGVFYQLLTLRNREEPHSAKYEMLLMKGWFDGAAVEADLEVVNPGLLAIVCPKHGLDLTRLTVPELPKAGSELAIRDPDRRSVVHHFYCQEVLPRREGADRPLIRVEYLETMSLLEVVNDWLDIDDRLDAV